MNSLTAKDRVSFLQFAVLAVIVLSILPNKTYGPYNVVNPYQIGWLVVFISGISLLSYVALRLLGQKIGLGVIAFLGGLISTTATTLVYAKHSARSKQNTPIALHIILLAHMVLFFRIGVIVSVVDIGMLKFMLPWLSGGLLFGFAYFIRSYKKNDGTQDKTKMQMSALEFSNPAEMKSAIGFAGLFSVVLLLSAWVNDVFADAGVYVVAFISGLTDVDAITISNLKLHILHAMSPHLVVSAVLLAFISNLMFKLGVVFMVGDKSLRKPLMISFSLLALGSVIGLQIGFWLLG